MIHKNWVTAPDIPVPPEVLNACGGDALLAKILCRRGLTDANQVRGFLHPDLYEPSSPYSFADMHKAVERLLLAAKTQEPVLIWGDFDADGQTSTTILYEAFTAIGLNVQYHIPLREGEGHGIREKPLRKYLEQGIRLIVTCDTGISEHKSIHVAAEHGVDVIITDHHELPPVLPEEAYAIINPRMLPEGHPLESLPGCGVAYLLSQALLSASGKEDMAENGLDLAAIGIVADLAALKGDTRYLLQRGLAILRQNRRPGLASLYQLNDLDPEVINEEHLGFLVAPRLNALGRLADASLAVEFFTTRDAARAQYLAQTLDDLNTHRKVLTDQVLQGALAQVEQHPSWESDALLVLAHPDWPGGVLGIVANSIVNRYQKPAILFQIGNDGLARGSARSVPGINITRAIADHREQLFSFGGHPMAAGLALSADWLDEFRQVMHHTVAEMALTAPPPEELTIDAEFDLDEVNLELAERLNQLAPFGQGNPAPVLAAPLVKVEKSTAVGKLKDHLSIQLQGNGKTISSIWWQAADLPLPTDWFRLAYTVRENTYNGNRQAQIEWIDWNELPEGIAHPTEPAETEWIDCRRRGDWSGGRTARRVRGADVCVFAEGEWRVTAGGVDRNHLTRAAGCVLVTFPPGPEELSQVIRTVGARKYWLVGANRGPRTMSAFLKRLLGVIQYQVQNSGSILQLSLLAAATSEREVTVGYGIRYLAARGEFTLLEITAKTAQINLEKQPPQTGQAEIQQKIERNLAESNAFRRSLLDLPLQGWQGWDK